MSIGDRLADVIQLGLLESLLKLRTKVPGHLAQIASHLAECAKHWRQILGTDHNDHDDRDDEQFGPTDIEHSKRLLD